MIELLEESARRDPDAVAVIGESAQTTFGELTVNARATAAALAERGIERFGVVHQDAAVLMALLGGASLSGAEPAVYPPLEHPGAADEMARRFDHDILVSDDELETEAEVIGTDQLFAHDGAPPEAPPEARPLLILTTGTTGEPRGVRHDWKRLMRSVAHIEPSPGVRWLLAWGPQQFAGMLMLLFIPAATATLVAPFPRGPREGLAAMREHGVTHVSATPTFWRFLLAEMRSDGGEVPKLRQVTLGGEAVPEPLLADLRSAFPDAKVSQFYGANEFGRSLSVRDGRNGLPASWLEADDDADVALKIVDGELWVRTRVGMDGYYGGDGIDPGAWRATGDLVEVKDDRIFFRGRTSDVINVGGVKVHPLPTEERISSVPGAVLVRVYGRPNRLTGAIVAAEVVPAEGADTEELEEAIREACADLPPAARPRSIKFVDEITIKGGKVRRARA